MNIIAITNDKRLINQIAALYCTVFNKTNEQEFAERVVRHIGYEGFKGVAALNEEGLLIGFSYGYTSLKGQFYHDLLKIALSEENNQHWLEDCFECVELSVHTDYRGKGLGTILHNILLENAPNKTSILTTQVDNDIARRMYNKLNWIDVKEPIYPGETAYVIMGNLLQKDTFQPS
ncbi:acetyltransferase [Bacillus manliponensis]|uniref:Acetyltransferase n=1 Tax=Bacillus manliponensis TaxID=574376 RepID=A0A073JWP1_9BACI|nr:GNAT family N-acetyltransferase [Bacillus manliponensis]KEK18632.1 acetyltransferase [Bacillus manliponensis]